MKNFHPIALLCAAAAFLQGCVMYSDKDEFEDPQLDAINIIYPSCVEPVLRMAELADFYDRYQSIREDRERAEALGTAYFGDAFDPMKLFYEEFTVNPSWGMICSEDTEGTYVAYPSQDFQDMDTEYHIIALGGRRYSISCETSGGGGWRSFRTEAEVYVDDSDRLHISSLDIVYNEDVEGRNVSVEVKSAEDNLSLPLCKAGEYSYYPVSGMLMFTVTGTVSDVFPVRFSEDSIEIGSNVYPVNQQ